MAKIVKELFLSKNYLVIDSVTDGNLVFSPYGDGTDGGDVIYLRGGRWSFRINDFLAGELLPDGTREDIESQGKGYSVNYVYEDKDASGAEVKAPKIYTTYRNPANIQALDGQLVQVAGVININKDGLASVALQSDILRAIQEKDFDTDGLATSEKQDAVKATVDGVKAIMATAAKQDEIGTSIEDIKDVIDDVKADVSELKATIGTPIANRTICYMLYNTLMAESLGTQVISLKNMLNLTNLALFGIRDAVGGLGGSGTDNVMVGRSVNLVENGRYAAGTRFKFSDSHYICSLNTVTLTLLEGSGSSAKYLALGEFCEYKDGAVQKLNGFTFLAGDCTEIMA